MRGAVRAQGKSAAAQLVNLRTPDEAPLAFGAVALAMHPLVNLGVSLFAAFMLATLTVTGRHMMFRITAEEDDAHARGE